jgi:transcriptional regulator with XRE-family HTH domain
MNTKSNDIKNIVNSFNALFNHLSEKEKLDNEAKLIMFRFLDVVERKREKLGWTRKQFAEKLGTSASYITQLLRGDKLINMTMLAKMQQVMDFHFEILEQNPYAEQTIHFNIPKVGKQGFWMFRNFNPDYNSNQPVPNPDDNEIAA